LITHLAVFENLNLYFVNPKVGSEGSELDVLTKLGNGKDNKEACVHDEGVMRILLEKGHKN
jgi:hypothetical protein